MKVAALRCSDYEEERVFLAVRKGIELIGGIGLLKGKVLLKPNLLGFYHPDRGITTHPAVVKAIAKLTKSIGGRPIIADSPGMGIPYTRESLKKLYRITQMEGLNAELNYDPEFKGFFSQDRGFRLIKPIGEVDSVVNIPKLKTHSFTILSCSVKNLFGLIPGFDKLGYHSTLSKVEEFSSMLFSLAEVVKPKLTVVDGIVGMEGNGPAGGVLRKVGWIIISDNPILADLAVCRLIGWRPEIVPGFSKRAELFDKGEWLGEEVVPLSPPFRLPQGTAPWRRLGRYLKPLFTAKPVISKGCVSCGVCQKTCPKGAIKIKGDTTVIDDSLCIRCYCCQELCPHQAILLKSSIWAKTFSYLVEKRIYRR